MRSSGPKAPAVTPPTFCEIISMEDGTISENGAPQVSFWISTHSAYSAWVWSSRKVTPAVGDLMQKVARPWRGPPGGHRLVAPVPRNKGCHDVASRRTTHARPLADRCVTDRAQSHQLPPAHEHLGGIHVHEA